MPSWLRVTVSLAVILLGVIGYGFSQLPALGAGGLLYPGRRQAMSTPPSSCEVVTFAGVGVALKGWRCRPSGLRRGAVVYLHGVADNRASGAAIIERFVARGFEVIVYDSRAHGESDGNVCTYGYFEKQDLRLVLDRLEPGPIVLIGSSLGAAVALQAAAEDARITAIVAAETFSDLRTVATERAPFFFTEGVIDRAFELAQQRGHFDVRTVSPVDAARNVTAAVLLIHGDADVDTPPDHSRRVFSALAGPKKLMIVAGAAHNESLRDAIWPAIEEWLDEALRSVGARRI
jgi:uncharacterized protein